MPLEFDGPRSYGLVEYHGSMVEYRGQVFQADDDPDFSGRLQLRKGREVILRNCRPESVSPYSPGCIDLGPLRDTHEDEIRDAEAGHP